jgi:serine/threonine-protein kinase
LFSGETPAAAVQNLLHGEIELPSHLVPDLPASIDQVVLRALARDPGERFESARAMAEVLEQAIAPCSTLELASWVESLVGEELSARAELLLEVEGLCFADFTSAMPHPLSSSAAQAPRLRAPGADAPERPSGSVNLSAGSEDAGRRLLRKGWLVPVLVAIAAAFFVLWGRTRATPPETAPAISRQALALTPLSVNASVRTELGAAQPEPPAPTEPVSSVVSAAPRKNARISASARPKAASNCDVPYVIDSNGVKRFKEACF